MADLCLVLAYHGDSWTLPIGALGPTALLLLTNKTVLKIELNRFETCQQVSRTSMKWGSKTHVEDAKGVEGKFSQLAIQTACASLLQAQQERNGQMEKLLAKTGQNGRSELKRRLQGITLGHGARLGKGIIKKSMQKAEKLVKEKSQQDYFGHPALNPSLGDPFYRLLLSDQQIAALLQFIFEVRWKAACGDKKAITAGYWCLTGILRVVEEGLIKRPVGKLTMRSMVVQLADSFLEVSI